MKFEMFSRVAFGVDMPDRHICKGDIATIVEYFDEPEPGYALEIFNALGESVDVVTARESELEPLREDQIICVRKIVAEVA
jgi:hypothetical protein